MLCGRSGLTWQHKAGARHGGSKHNPPGIGMEHGHDAQEAAAGSKVEDVLAGDCKGSQKVGPVAVQHSLQSTSAIQNCRIISKWT